MLLLQSTWVRFPTLTWWFIIILTPVPRDSVPMGIWPPRAPGMHVVHDYNAGKHSYT